MCTIYNIDSRIFNAVEGLWSPEKKYKSEIIPWKVLPDITLEVIKRRFFLLEPPSKTVKDLNLVNIAEYKIKLNIGLNKLIKHITYIKTYEKFKNSMTSSQQEIFRMLNELKSIEDIKNIRKVSKQSVYDSISKFYAKHDIAKIKMFTFKKQEVRYHLQHLIEHRHLAFGKVLDYLYQVNGFEITNNVQCIITDYFFETLDNNKVEYIKKSTKEAHPVARYIKKRKRTDPLFKLRCDVAVLIKNSLAAKNYSKKSKTQEILGCDFSTFQDHLEQSCVDNYKISSEEMINLGYTLHLDHIVPCASATTEEELLKLNHYSNFQYLTAEDNLRKSARMDWDRKELTKIVT